MATKSAEKMLYQRASGAFTAYRILGDSVQKDKSILLQQEDTLKALFPPPICKKIYAVVVFKLFLLHFGLFYVFVIFAFERTFQKSSKIRLCPERVETRRRLTSFFYVFLFLQKHPKLAWNWLVELGMVLKVNPKGRR